MKEKFLLMAILLICCILVQAEQPTKTLFFRVLWEDGHYKIDELRTVMDYPLETDENGNYLVKLVDEKGITLYQHKTKKFNMELMPSREPELGEMTEGEIVIDFDELYGTKKGQMFFILPYLKEAKTLTFEHGTNILAKADLSILCNYNGKCEETENYLSCPEDCSLSEKDNYCLAYKDGTCDPDCIEGIDPDCGEEKKPSGFDLIGITIIAGITLILLLILLSKKRKKQPRY